MHTRPFCILCPFAPLPVEPSGSVPELSGLSPNFPWGLSLHIQGTHPGVCPPILKGLSPIPRGLSPERARETFHIRDNHVIIM